MSDDLVAEPEAWVDRHGDVLYRYALLRLRSPELAADVVQETFLEALRAWESFAGRSTERTWLIGILRHKIVDQLRGSGRAQAAVNGVALNGAIEHRSTIEGTGGPRRRRGGAIPAGPWRHTSSGRSSANASPSFPRGSPMLFSCASSTA